MTLLCPLGADEGHGASAVYVEGQCLGDVLGEHILLAPLEAWRQPHTELLSPPDSPGMTP